MDGEVKPEVIARSMVKFSKPGYRVEALKVQVPVNMAFVAGSPGWKRNSLHSRIGDGLLSAAEVARMPFIYMSQGVRNDAFQYALVRTGHRERRRCGFCRTRPEGTGRLVA